jgi:ribulose-phosphate 3-epimerase
VQVAPSLLSTDFGHLARALATVEEAPADLVHLDVMDGSFVGEITFGAKLVADLRPRSRLPFDVHLMVREPARHVERFARAGADLITVHLEACRDAVDDPRVLLQAIRDTGAGAGIAISPPTPAAAVEPLLDVIDVALVMTVHPGAGGQELIPACLDKARELVERRYRGGHTFRISTDGGLHRGNVGSAAEAGVDIAVIGSAIWRAAVPAEEIRAIRATLAACAEPT